MHTVFILLLDKWGKIRYSRFSEFDLFFFFSSCKKNNSWPVIITFAKAAVFVAVVFLSNIIFSVYFHGHSKTWIHAHTLTLSLSLTHTHTHTHTQMQTPSRKVVTTAASLNLKVTMADRMDNAQINQFSEYCWTNLNFSASGRCTCLRESEFYKHTAS